MPATVSSIDCIKPAQRVNLRIIYIYMPLSAYKKQLPFRLFRCGDTLPVQRAVKSAHHQHTLLDAAG